MKSHAEKNVGVRRPERREGERKESALEDKRPEAFAQLKRIEQIQSSPRVRQLNAVQRMIDSSSKVHQLQHKRDKEEDETATQRIAKDRPVQRALKDTVPDNTRIVIDNPRVPDHGDAGSIVRNSRAVSTLKAVEFDNDRGTLYRVHPVEMTASDPQIQRQYGLRKDVFGNQSHEVTIASEIEIEQGSAVFEAYNGTVYIGNLTLDVQKGWDSMIISSINTQIAEPQHRIPGLGTLLMNIASVMAGHFGKNKMTLAAVKERELHPAPFYQKWGFKVTGDSDPLQAAASLGKSFEEYLKGVGGPVSVDMEASPQDVMASTHNSLISKGWEAR